MPLPSDEEYLRELYELFADESAFATARLDPTPEADVASLDPEIAAQLRTEFADPRTALTGLQVNEIKRAALTFLRDEATAVEGIPVGLLPSRELNAAAVRTPRNGAVILPNSLVFGVLPVLFFCYAALDSWETEDPVTTEISDLALADAILSLAAYCATSDPACLRGVPAVASYGAEDEEMIEMAVMMECFILLHEYGHILKGHLSSDHITALEMDNGESQIAAFHTRWNHEYEADAFAVARMMATGTGTLRMSDVAVWPGLLLSFFGLVETVALDLSPSQLPATHPPAQERWRRVATLVELESTPEAYATRFDYWFGRLANWWASEHAHSGGAA